MPVSCLSFLIKTQLVLPGIVESILNTYLSVTRGGIRGGGSTGGVFTTGRRGRGGSGMSGGSLIMKVKTYEH